MKEFCHSCTPSLGNTYESYKIKIALHWNIWFVKRNCNQFLPLDSVRLGQKHFAQAQAPTPLFRAMMEVTLKCLTLLDSIHSHRQCKLIFEFPVTFTITSFYIKSIANLFIFIVDMTSSLQI